DLGYKLSCKVTATNEEGRTEATSSSLKIPGIKPANTKAPEASGTPAVGETLSCSTGSWNGAPTPTYTYQWLREGTPIGGATKPTYSVQGEDRTHTLSCKVTATNSEGEGKAESNGIHIPGLKPLNTVPPSVSGTAKVGETLTCSTGTWNGLPTPTYTYQWLRSGSEIAGATNVTYIVAGADRDTSLSCKGTAPNQEGKASEGSANSIRIPGLEPKNTKAPEVSGPTAEGDTLSCSTGTWEGVPTPTYTYQWLREGTPIGGAIESTHKVVGEDLGYKLSCKVTATNEEGRTEATSSSLKIPGIKPANTKAPEASGTPAVGETLSCSTGSWNGA